MAKTTNIKSTKVLSQCVNDYVREKMVEYGSYTLQERAIPELKDGLKPVHRRLIWTGYVGGYNNNGTTKKCAKIVGDCFAAGTLISTPNGLVSIENLEIGDEVLTSKGTYKVTQCFENPPSDMVKLTLEDGRVILATPKQEVKVKAKDGTFMWKSIKDLTEDDLIVSEI